ncbi:MAG: thioredoxin family protein [Bacteroidota bacterium]
MSSFFAEKLKHTYAYHEFNQMVEGLVGEGKTTGPNQSDALLHYTELNLKRMKRLDKTTKLTEELTQMLQGLKKQYIWLVITEGWCGDAAQIIPALHAMAEVSENISLRLILRDEHLDLMEQYLTNGAKSIPVLICLDADSLDVLGHWGPRPLVPQEMVIKNKESHELSHDDLVLELQKWYNKDKTLSIQQELLRAIEKWEAGQ